MQMRISWREIRKTLQFLHSRLPKPPTAVKGLYALPPHLAKAVRDTDFSQASLQEVADHVGYFLGILRRTTISIAPESYGSAVVGLYEAIGEYHQEIHLTRKVAFELKHILAILAHECTHNYLHHHGLTEPSERDNEVLTDLAAAYLGLGHLLIRGYERTEWTSNHWNILVASGHTKHSMYIGYLTPATIRNAVVASTELRGWDPQEVLSTLPFFDRIEARVLLWPYKVRSRRQARAARKRTHQLTDLRLQLTQLRRLYHRVSDQLERVATYAKDLSVSAEEGRRLVDIANEIATGSTDHYISSLSEKADTLLRDREFGREDVNALALHVANLTKTISSWQRLLNKYA